MFDYYRPATLTGRDVPGRPPLNASATEPVVGRPELVPGRA
jgi:hypothetical protein